jgi:DNA (cytosine-5)-methyltransferase 1
VCSGIEAATVAWHPLGWTPVAFAEVDKFPSAVLAHHYPAVPNHGDMTRFKEWPDAAVDVLVGGTPCQSFSVAGLRAGLDDPRGNLMLTYLAIADRYRPKWLVWENVPGVLSSNGGRDFGTFLGGLGELGYGFAYRVLDAQHFGLAQRRQRVFVVGCLGDWRRAAAVLFERASLSGHPPPRREAGQDVAGTVVGGASSGGHGRFASADGAAQNMLVAHALRADGFDASEDGTGRGTPIVPVLAPCLTQNYGKQPDNSDTSAGPMLVAVAFHENQRAELTLNDTAGAINSGGGKPGQGYPAVAFTNQWRDENLDVFSTLKADCNGALPMVQTAMQVRRLTPRECERLQGFPDDYTLIPYRGKPAADGPRYKALGNSMAVPCIRWIGERMDRVQEACSSDDHYGERAT